MKKNNENEHVNFVEFAKQQDIESRIKKQKEIIILILNDIRDPNIINKIYTYIWTITH